MPTSAINDIYKIKGVQYIFAEHVNDSLYFHAKTTKKFGKCPKCSSKRFTRKGKKVRKFKLPPFGSKPCFFQLQIPRLKCSKCSHIFWMRLPFMKGKSSVTPAFASYVLDLLKFGTVKHVANFVRVGWDMIKNIHKDYLKNLYAKISLKNIRYISIDEISLRKGHSYMTIVTDIETGRVIYSCEGRDSQSISPFLAKLSIKAKSLKAVSIDMSKSYQLAVKKHLPFADIVFDHFHVMAVVNKALDEVRKQEFALKSKTGNKLTKGGRFLLLWNYEKLDPLKKKGLESLLRVNEVIAKAYLIKEQFRIFWWKKDKKQAAKFLVTWILDSFESGIESLVKAARTILRHADGLLNYFEHRISNGKAEGINNKIKTLKRQAYGFRDMEYFKLRLLHLHQQRYSFSG